MRKKSIFSKLFFLVMLCAMVTALYGCGKKDPKESYKAASLATDKKYKEESEKAISENPVLKRMDEISKNGTDLSMSMESSVDPRMNTIAFGMKDDPKTKVMSMTVDADASKGTMYLDDNNITLEIFEQKLFMPAQGFADKLKTWLVDNALIQYAPGLEAGDFKDINIGYSDLVGLGKIPENLSNNYMATFRALEDVAQYKSGPDEDLALTDGTVKAQTVILTVNNEDYKAWLDKLIAQVKEDKDIKQLLTQVSLLATMGGQPSPYNMDTVVAAIEKARDFDASSFSIKAYIVNGIIQKEVITLDEPDVEKDKVEISVAFLGSKNFMDKTEILATNEDGEKISVIQEGSWIPKDNKVVYSYAINPPEGQGTPFSMNIDWDLAKKDGDNFNIKYNGMEKTAFVGLDDEKNIDIHFAAEPQIEKVSVKVKPLTETITVPTDAKNVFDMTKQELIDLILVR